MKLPEPFSSTPRRRSRGAFVHFAFWRFCSVIDGSGVYLYLFYIFVFFPLILGQSRRFEARCSDSERAGHEEKLIYGVFGRQVGAGMRNELAHLQPHTNERRRRLVFTPPSTGGPS